jgi:membrane protease YdiL (CAAX protease family)
MSVQMIIDDARIHRVNNVQKPSIVILTVLVLILVFSYILAMFLGPALFFQTPQGLNFSTESVQPPILLFLLFGFYSPFILTSGEFFLFLWSLFVLCFAGAYALRESFHKVLSKAFSRPFSKLFNNWLFTMPIVACMLFAAVTYIIEFQNLFNVPTGALPTPQTDTEAFNLYLNLSYAPIVEELGFRISAIGVLVLARLLLIQSEQSASFQSFRQRLGFLFASFLCPDKAKSMVGVKNVATNGIREGISRSEWAMLLITSLVFGAAHLLSGIGWEVGKITSTFVQGFVFGIVYLAYGAQAPILLHWFFNYYFYSYELGTSYYSSGFQFFSWIEDLTLYLGVFFLVILAVWRLQKIISRRRMVTPEPTASVPVPPESL